jgi:hypothetical protein
MRHENRNFFGIPSGESLDRESAGWGTVKAQKATDSATNPCEPPRCRQPYAVPHGTAELELATAVPKRNSPGIRGVLTGGRKAADT